MMVVKKSGRLVTVEVHPYATQWGEIVVPEEYQTPDEIEQYISEYFDDIKFGTPDLDYEGTDFEFFVEEPDYE